MQGRTQGAGGGGQGGGVSAGRAISNAVETQRIHRTMGLIEARKTLRGDLPRRFSHGIGGFLPYLPDVVKAASRTGYGANEEDFTRYCVNGGWAAPLFTTVGDSTFMNLETKALEASDAVERIVNGYRDKLGGLKASLQNDSASIKASAERVEKEHARMNAAMRSTISLMTSPEMAEAIRNAERLAAALQAIGEAKSASAQFALVVE